MTKPKIVFNPGFIFTTSFEAPSRGIRPRFPRSVPAWGDGTPYPAPARDGRSDRAQALALIVAGIVGYAIAVSIVWVTT